MCRDLSDTDLRTFRISSSYDEGLYLSKKKNIWIEEDAKAWHLSLRINRKDRPTWAVDPKLDILSPPMNNYMREKSDKLMWTIKAFYGDFIREEILKNK